MHAVVSILVVEDERSVVLICACAGRKMRDHLAIVVVVVVAIVLVIVGAAFLLRKRVRAQKIRPALPDISTTSFFR
jgi:high-affinity Fe2+/Pb2+ permease